MKQNKITKAAYAAQQRRIQKRIAEVGRERSALEKESDELVRNFTGIHPWDEVAYVGPDPKRYVSGIAIVVRALWDGSPVIVVRPWAKRDKDGKRCLIRVNTFDRRFDNPKLLKVVRTRDNVAPYWRGAQLITGKGEA